MNCHACGAQLSAGARFCHRCGAKMGRDQTTGWRAGLPWAIAGLSVGALATLLALRITSGSGEAASSPPAANRPPMAGGVGRTTDISQMSPEERASRLFDRVMRHAEAGQTDSMRFFMPMALQAHQMLPRQTEDSRFHLGLLQLANGNSAAALAQADSIGRMTPSHLFIYVLRARALTERGDAAGARRAYAGYLRAEAAERGKQRPEYADHSTTLDQFGSEARQRSGG